MSKPMKPIAGGNFPKPYTIAMVGDNDAEINMYGEVVQAHPTDWWTGEKIPGNFICLDEFMRDLDELNTKDNITIHINSVGGDFYAGLAIYNRLRSLKASITTINDSLAASAGSIIFMAGDKGKRKVNAASNLMVHGVLSFLYGYYNVVDMKAKVKETESHNKALIAAYVEATGLDEETVKSAISKDTYMTGQDAVDAGWADEVISASDDAPVNMKLNPTKSALMVNGMAVAARCFGKLPENIPQMSVEEWAEVNADTVTINGLVLDNSMQPAPRADINTNPFGGKDMDIKNTEELRTAFPDLVAQIETAARVDGAKTERERIKGIEDIEAAIGDAEMVKNAKYGENPVTAQQVAFEALKAQAAIGASVLGKIEDDAKNSGAGGVTPIPAPAVEPKDQTDDEKAEALLIGAIPANMKKEDK